MFEEKKDSVTALSALLFSDIWGGVFWVWFRFK